MAATNPIGQIPRLLNTNVDHLAMSVEGLFYDWVKPEELEEAHAIEIIGEQSGGIRES